MIDLRTTSVSDTKHHSHTISVLVSQ